MSLPIPDRDNPSSDTSAADTPPDTIDRAGLPPDVVLLAPATGPAPLRAPTGAWGLVVVAARLTTAMGNPLLRLAGLHPFPDIETTDTTDLLAGVWVPQQPPADLHDGDVVVRLHASTPGTDITDIDADGNLDGKLDVEVLTATGGAWRLHTPAEGLGQRWPQAIALTVAQLMRENTHRDQSSTFLSMLTSVVGKPEPAPDAVAALVEAGLLTVGEQVRWGSRVATVGERYLYDGTSLPTVDPHGDVDSAATLADLGAVLTGATVNVLATRHTRYPVNGWHLWHLTREGDQRVLDALRADLDAIR